MNGTPVYINPEGGKRMMRAVFEDESSGSVVLNHDAQTGAIFLEFERLELDNDLVLPLCSVALSTEHVLAWVESVLGGLGRRCRRISFQEGGKRLQAMLRLTESDPHLVYTAYKGPNVILIRGGCVLKVPFAAESMNGFLRRIKEGPTAEQTATTGALLAKYAHGLMA